MDNTKLNIEQISTVLEEARRIRIKCADIRYGQSFFNALYTLFPEVGDSVRATENDPFYSDIVLIKCIYFISNNETNG